jgi:hypothetical protein
MSNLTYFDKETWLSVMWEALFAHREKNIPEGVDTHDREWDDICTAMAWVREELGLPDTADEG